MLKVLPIQSKQEQELICHKCSVEYKPELLAYSAEMDGVLAGVCQFKLTAEGGILYDIAAADDYTGDLFEPLFVMGRGTLNFIDLCGVHRAYFDGEVKDEGLLRAIGFTKNESGRYDINLEGFFTDHCKNHKA
jgi:hypothetical protein